MDVLVGIGTVVLGIATIVLVVVTKNYADSTSKLLTEAENDRADRLERERSEQARLIGGYPEWQGGSTPDVVYIAIHLTNASPLPVRDLWARLWSVRGPDFLSDRGELVVERTLQVLEPGKTTIECDVPLSKALSLRLELDFDADNRQRWRKYETIDEPLKRVPQRDTRGRPTDWTDEERAVQL